MTWSSFFDPGHDKRHLSVDFLESEETVGLMTHLSCVSGCFCLAAVGRFDLQFQPIERLLRSAIDKPTSGDYRSGGVSAIKEKEHTGEVHD
jgi:hypothetical protein